MVIFVNFRMGFHKMAEKNYLQVFPDYYIFIFLSFPFFDNHINPCKIWGIATKTCLKRIETPPFKLLNN